MAPPLLSTLVLASLLAGCGSACENAPSQTIASPSGALKAVVFSRNCGATTEFNTQVSVLRTNETLSNDGGNTFISGASVPIVVRWSSDSALQISGVGDASAIKKNSIVSGVLVTYAK